MDKSEHCKMNTTEKHIIPIHCTKSDEYNDDNVDIMTTIQMERNEQPWFWLWIAHASNYEIQHFILHLCQRNVYSNQKIIVKQSIKRAYVQTSDYFLTTFFCSFNSSTHFEDEPTLLTSRLQILAYYCHGLVYWIVKMKMTFSFIYPTNRTPNIVTVGLTMLLTNSLELSSVRFSRSLIF